MFPSSSPAVVVDCHQKLVKSQKHGDRFKTPLHGYLHVDMGHILVMLQLLDYTVFVLPSLYF